LTFSLRNRVSVKLSWSRLAVLAWLRRAASSFRRAMRLTSAALVASVTWFIAATEKPVNPGNAPIGSDAGPVRSLPGHIFAAYTMCDRACCRWLIFKTPIAGGISTTRFLAFPTRERYVLVHRGGGYELGGPMSSQSTWGYVTPTPLAVADLSGGDSMKLSRRRGVTQMETMIVGGIAAAMMGLLLPALSSSIANSQGSICRNNLARLAQALNAYHDAQGKYPPAMGQPAVQGAEQGWLGGTRPNWVILTLPYLGEQALYDTVNWSTLLSSTQGNGLTAAANGQATFSNFTSTTISGLQCPADTNTGVLYQVNRSTNQFSSQQVWQYYGRANYAANGCLMPPFNYGNNSGSAPIPTACGGSTQPGWSFASAYSWKTRGVMGLSTSLSRAQITDGTSTTILIGETRAGINAFDPRGIWADGTASASSAWFHINGPDNCAISDDLSPDRYEALLNSLGSGGQQLAAQQCMDFTTSYSGNPVGNFRSQHTGGVFVAMCDGSVSFVSSSVEVGDKGSYYPYLWATISGSFGMGTWERLNASGDGLVVDDSTDANYDSTVTPYVLGDMNGDGVLDNYDIAATELALVDPAAYLAMYPNLTDYQQRGDINQDGSFNNMDIGDFEALLAGVL